MKKLLILSIAMFSIFSCSSDDDNLDPIIGSWNLTSTKEGGVEKINECDKLGIIQFNENGTWTNENYDSDSDLNSSDCVKGDTTAGTWVALGDNSYSFQFGSTPANVETLIFIGNTFTITSDDLINTYTRI